MAKKSTKTIGTDKLEASELISLYKTIRKESASEESPKLSVGTTEIDMLVRIHGTLEKGEDFEQRVVAKAEPWSIIATLLSKLNGVTIESVIKGIA